MSDLRTRIQIQADVDANGDATVTRTWHLSNLSSRPLDLTRFRFFVDVTSQDVVVQSFADGSGTRLAVSTESISPEKTRINCYFDLLLQAHQSYDLILLYRHPRYLTHFRRSKAWLVAEYFQRHGPLEGIDFLEEEPQSVDYTLSLHDPRPALLGIRNPFQEWTTEITQQCREVRSRNSRSIRYERGLRPHDRSPDLHVLSLLSHRSTARAVVVFTVTTILSVVATWGLLAAFGP